LFKLLLGDGADGAVIPKDDGAGAGGALVQGKDRHARPPFTSAQGEVIVTPQRNCNNVLDSRTTSAARAPGQRLELCARLASWGKVDSLTIIRMMNTSFAAVCFDFDGTLADNFAAIALAVNHVRGCRQLPPLTLSEVKHFVGRGIDHLVKHT